MPQPSSRHYRLHAVAHTCCFLGTSYSAQAIVATRELEQTLPFVLAGSPSGTHHEASRQRALMAAYFSSFCSSEKKSVSLLKTCTPTLGGGANFWGKDLCLWRSYTPKREDTTTTIHYPSKWESELQNWGDNQREGWAKFISEVWARIWPGTRCWMCHLLMIWSAAEWRRASGSGLFRCSQV